jgi:hypothetical protein
MRPAPRWLSVRGHWSVCWSTSLLSWWLRLGAVGSDGRFLSVPVGLAVRSSPQVAAPQPRSALTSHPISVGSPRAGVRVIPTEPAVRRPLLEVPIQSTRRNERSGSGSGDRCGSVEVARGEPDSGVPCGRAEELLPRHHRRSHRSPGEIRGESNELVQLRAEIERGDRPRPKGAPASRRRMSSVRRCGRERHAAGPLPSSSSW